MKLALVLSRDIVNKWGEIYEAAPSNLIQILHENNFNSVVASSNLLIDLSNLFNVDLIILQGGEDFGENTLRDNSENQILAYAIRNGIPVLGICRGMQIINLFFGGSLKKIHHHVNVIHPVIGEFSGSVNSFHTLGVDKLGVGLHILSKAEDGLIESLSTFDNKILGVMWHPERSDSSISFRTLLEKLFTRL